MTSFLPYPFPSRAAASTALGALLFFLSPSGGVRDAAGAQPDSPAPAPASAPPAPPPPVPASVPHPHAYGILVGSNAGGAGQATLRYAEDDARRMGAVLKELGRYGTTDMRVLVRPDGARVLATIDEVAAKLRAHQAKGEQAVLVFYYSGHARANAFSLGSDELSIATLREKLRQVPSTLTLVVLDACQSGQFARTKGAEPAADFSFNSVSRLTTKGIAVMASSSAEELSQESDELHSSYFTHHLIVALRGAADADGDGRVSLDEAYRYAYRRTLVSTSQTQVGGQHVTLETDLAGQGDVPVTYPVDARSQLELPAALDGRVLVQHKPSGNVVAEVQKAPGSAVKLAFAAGSYKALVRSASGGSARVLECSLTLVDTRPTALDLGACAPVKLAGVAKGETPPERDQPSDDDARGKAAAAPWQIESGLGVLWRQEDAFTARLNEFGYRYKEPFLSMKAPRWRFHAGASKGILPHVSVGAYVHTLGGDRYERTLSDSDDWFSWDTYGVSGFIRASTVPIGRMSPRSSFIELYAQGAIGLSLGVTTLSTGSSRAPAREESTDTHWGWVLGGHAGAAFATRGPVIFFLQGGYEYAPTISNLVGDVHNSGGPSAQIGARLRFE
ncbi:MAG: caspase family protein [Labilithrix sp.]|nr:caspase family protein [Labilithrix sp.]